jgi:hypothetical protein
MAEPVVRGKNDGPAQEAPHDRRTGDKMQRPDLDTKDATARLVAKGAGWYDVYIGGAVVDTVRGERAARKLAKDEGATDVELT